jgi:hypothetical protein
LWRHFINIFTAVASEFEHDMQGKTLKHFDLSFIMGQFKSVIALGILTPYIIDKPK